MRLATIALVAAACLFSGCSGDGDGDMPLAPTENINLIGPLDDGGWLTPPTAFDFNPTKNSMTISFSMPEYSYWDILISEFKSGREIRRFAGIGEAGTYEIVWDGRDENGSYPPPGIYTRKVTLGGYFQRIDIFRIIY